MESEQSDRYKPILISLETIIVTCNISEKASKEIAKKFLSEIGHPLDEAAKEGDYLTVLSYIEKARKFIDDLPSEMKEGVLGLFEKVSYEKPYSDAEKLAKDCINKG